MITYLHLLGRHPGPLQGPLDGEPAELGGREVLELAEQPPHRGAGSGDDDRTGHNADLRRGSVCDLRVVIPAEFDLTALSIGTEMTMSTPPPAVRCIS